MGLISGMSSSEEQHERSVVLRISSLTKGLSAVSAKRTRSLPIMPTAGLTAIYLHEHIVDMPNMNIKVQDNIKRSLSAPVNLSSSLEHRDSFGVDSAVLTSLHPVPARGVAQDNAVRMSDVVDGEGAHNFEDKAVCRICLVELGDGGDTLKMECSCKGELALAHQECAVEWFSIKGNTTCDVCKQDVQNLPITSLKTHYNQAANGLQPDAFQQGEVAQYRVWQDVPVLVLVSMLAYFCLLEQLLVTEMGTHALALALPFSCVLGLLSSMIASIVVSRSHIWAYASIQFLIVILFAHIMYNLLRVTPVLAVLLSSFIGFGITMSVNSLVMEYLTWGARQVLHARQQNVTNEQQHEQSRERLEIDNGDSDLQQIRTNAQQANAQQTSASQWR